MKMHALEQRVYVSEQLDRWLQLVQDKEFSKLTKKEKSEVYQIIVKTLIIAKKLQVEL
jgi:hypothetical protein